MICVPYQSHAHKADAYIRQTIPLMFARGLAGIRPGLGDRRPAVLIHQQARRGRYVPEHGPRDCVPDPADVELHGGDCDSWAAWLIREYTLAGYPVRLVTGGDAQDNFRHVWVEVYDAGRWHVSDPKGSQAGLAFGDEPQFDVTRRWVFDSGRAVEVTGVAVAGSGNSCCGVAGSSGDDNLDMVIRDYDDLQRWFTKRQWQLWFDRMDRQRWLREHTRLQQGLGTWYRSEILNEIGEKTLAAALKSGDEGARRIAEQDPHRITEPMSLQDANLVMVSNHLATVYDNEAAINALRHYAEQIGANPSASRDEMLAVVAARTAQEATALGIIYDEFVDALESYQQQGLPDDEARNRAIDDATGGAQRLVGSGFFASIGQFFQGIISEVGRGIRRLGQNILNLDRSAPWLSAYLMRPAGFMAQAELLKQVGNAMRDGKVTSFDETSFAREAGRTMVSSGQMLVAASPFIPGFGLIGAAVGAMSIAAGGLIQSHLQRAETNRQLAAQAEAQSAAATAAANERAQMEHEATLQQRREWFQTRAHAALEAGAGVTHPVTISDGRQFWGLWLRLGGGANAGQWTPAWLYAQDDTGQWGWHWTDLYQWE